MRSRSNLPWAWIPSDPGDEEIYVMNADGSGERNLTRTPASDWWPAWSPDGRKIVFVSSRGLGGASWPKRWWSGIYLMNADGSGLQTLVRHTGKEPAPAWSPDGRAIAFTGTGEDIFRINPDGRGLRRLTRHPELINWVPVWSP